MKMADNSLMLFKNNFESINRNCVEVETDKISKISCEDNGNGEATSSNEPEDGTLNISSDVSTQEETVEEYLAGNNKTEFNDQFLTCTEDNDNSREDISFKSNNVFKTNNDDDNELDLIEEKAESNPEQSRARTYGHNYIIRNLKKRSIKCNCTKMPQCFVSSCSNYYGKTRKNANIIYHMLPTVPQMISKWVKVCREDEENPPPHARVCSAHFSDGCYQRDLQHELLGLPLRKKLKQDAVPDLNLPVKTIKTKKQVLKNVVGENPKQKNAKVKENVVTNSKSQDIKSKTLKQQTNLASSIRKGIMEKKPKSTANMDISNIQPITIIDITTDEPIRKTSVIKKLPDLRAVKNNAELKQNVIGIKRNEKSTKQQKKLNVLDINKLNNINIGETLRKTKSNEDIIMHKRIITAVNNDKIKILENYQPKTKTKMKKDAINKPDLSITQFSKLKRVKSNQELKTQKETVDNNCSNRKLETGQQKYRTNNRSGVVKNQNLDPIKDIKIKRNKSLPDIQKQIQVERNKAKMENGQVKIRTNNKNEVVVITDDDDDAKNQRLLKPLKTKASEIKHQKEGISNKKQSTDSGDNTSSLKIFPNELNSGLKTEAIENKNHALQSKDIDQLERNLDKIKRRPMRSSIRIAKKKSIECLSDSFTEKVNNKRDSNRHERFSDKLKFMAKLQLRHQRNNYGVIDLDQFFEGLFEANKHSLNKMQIMENVVEGCNVQPSSPGHAEERSEDLKVKTETKIEELDQEKTNDAEDNKTDNENQIGKTKTENISNGVKDEPDSSEMQDESYSNTSSPKTENNKRKSESQNYPIKRLKSEIQENFASRDKIINDFINMADCTNLDQISSFSEQLLVEIKTLNEFAKEKEREWNNIIHLKKLKEELLLRMQRKRQILIINDKSDYSDLLNESQNGTVEESLRNTSPQSILKLNLNNSQKVYMNTSNVNGNLHRQKHIIPKVQNNVDLNGQGKRLTLDVQSIIADYRQRHPESVPRRGRRIRCSQSDGFSKYPSSIINFSSMALGSGAQVRQGDVSNDLGLLLNTINMSRQEASKLHSDPSGPNTQDTVSFKDMLLQFAKLSQNERNELIQNAIKPPPPYPEVTVHPVPTSTPPPPQTNSLLHGILTKTPTKQNSKSSFSPTLARLLTAPERNANNHIMGPSPLLSNAVQPSNMSISEILSTSKACNEITITPVDNQYESTPIKGKNMEDETEDSADRLVIDENNEADMKKQSNSDNNSDGGDDIPLCQGCNQKSAQFVCAGCGNQWYCSRDCQVNAWDEHSEVCSG